MEIAEQIKRFNDFLEKNYHVQILESVRVGTNHINVSFSKLMKFDPEFADALLEAPEETIKAAELAVEQFDLPLTVKNFRVRFNDMPESQKMKIRNIRTKQLGKLYCIEGVVRQKSDVRPQVTSAKFECPSCGNVISVLQLEKKFKEPSRCGCGRKGKFRLISKELIDAQGLVLEESPEDLEGGEQPKRINVFLKDDLVSPMTEKKTNPGSKVVVVGLVKEIALTGRDGSKLTRFDLLLEANYIESIQEDYYEVEISKEDEERIKELANDPRVYEKIINSVAPSIYGYEKIKEAIALQLAGGVRKIRSDGMVTRGDMHVLLIGDPGAAKSQLLKRIAKVAPKARYVSGKGVSGAGLSAAVVKDEFLQGWSLEAGALPLANKGVCCTTADSEFVLESGEKMSFEELFKNEKRLSIYPTFKVLGLNNKSNRIEPFKIKRAFKIKNDKKVFKIKTRTGRELNLTQDNEVLTCQDSKMFWKPVEKIKKNEYVAVPCRMQINNTDNFSKEFAYICGLIASGGQIAIDKRRASTRFYNTDKQLTDIFKTTMGSLGFKYSTYLQKAGRKSTIRDKTVQSKKETYIVYNSTKSFAEKVIFFGVPSGNKSSKYPLNNRIRGYSEDTIKSFIKGVFDGDGSIRLDPFEITLTTGLKENAVLFQDLLLRLGIISSVKKSTQSWHCDVRGAVNCLEFFETIGTNHFHKFERLQNICFAEPKDRINVLPNHEAFFKALLRKYRWKLGKNVYRYVWNYSKRGRTPSKYKLSILNKLINDPEIKSHINNDILWDKIASIEEVTAEYVYDFTMEDTNNFIANNIIMHNCIDELDKMSENDTAAMHEALENQTISISKANIQATLRAETTVLAAANPKFGRFDPYDIIAKQIDLPPALINRFDLIFAIKDLPNEERDTRMATHILNLHQMPDFCKPEISTELLKKYISYARRTCKPTLTAAAMDEIKKFYVEMRSKGSAEEAGIKSVPISARQLEALIRMAEATAKLRFGKKVTKKDARRAIDLLNDCLMQIGLDPETGKIDIDRIVSGISASQRSKIFNIKEIIAELEEKLGKTIPLDDVVREAKARNIDEAAVEEAIEKLKRSGDIFSPRPEFIQRI